MENYKIIIKYPPYLFVCIPVVKRCIAAPGLALRLVGQIYDWSAYYSVRILLLNGVSCPLSIIVIIELPVANQTLLWHD